MRFPRVRWWVPFCSFYTLPICLVFFFPIVQCSLYNYPLVKIGQLQEVLEKLFHIGKKNPRIPYYMDQYKLATISQHWDLDITVNDNLILSTLISNAVSWARKFTYLLSKSFAGCDVATSRTLYMCILFWSMLDLSGGLI